MKLEEFSSNNMKILPTLKGQIKHYSAILQWPYFSVRLWRHFVNFWVKIDVIKHMLS